MKSRWTTYLLLVAVVAVWGIVGWKIFAPAAEVPSASAPRLEVTRQKVAEDTLLLDYPDPFRKGSTSKAVRQRQSVVRALPSTVRRENVRITHLATLASGCKTLYILTIGNEQYELMRGAEAVGFRLVKSDRDSVYLCKNGISYGVKLCE